MGLERVEIWDICLYWKRCSVFFYLIKWKVHENPICSTFYVFFSQVEIIFLANSKLNFLGNFEGSSWRFSDCFSDCIMFYTGRNLKIWKYFFDFWRGTLRFFPQTKNFFSGKILLCFSWAQFNLLWQFSIFIHRKFQIFSSKNWKFSWIGIEHVYYTFYEMM